MATSELVDRLRASLEEVGLLQAVLTGWQTLAHLGCFEMPAEDWPVSNPFVTCPAALCLGPHDALLVAADFHLGDVPATQACITYRSYDFERAPDPSGELNLDAVRRAPHDGIALCRPGVRAKDVDREVRALLAEHGPTYPHHTGHGIGAAWSEEPRITPYNDMQIDEGMVLALEPAIYLPGWGGIRLEHAFVVRADGNEILTQFEHAL